MNQHGIQNPLRLLEASLKQCGDVIEAISANQADWPTPCAEWSVQDLLHHLLVQDLHRFTMVARGNRVEVVGVNAMGGADWTTRFSNAAEKLMDAWVAADLSEQVALQGGGEASLRSRIGLQITEFTVHSWDLAVATAVTTRLDDELAERSLEWSQRITKPEQRGPGQAFGPEVRAPLNAAIYPRMAAWFGRDPHFQPRSGDGL